MAPITWADFSARTIRLYRLAGRRPGTISKLSQVLGELGRVGVAATADLTTDRILAWLASYPDRSPETVKGLLGYVRAASRYAAEEGWLDRVPRFRRLLPRVEAAAEAPHLGLDELRRLLAHLAARAAGGDWRAGRLNALVALLASTGLRRDEALFLRVADVDPGSRLILLRSTPERPLKTPSSGQPVPMPPELAPILSDWMPRSGSSWLFPGARGLSAWSGGRPGRRPIDAIRGAGRECGIDTGLSFRILRHSWATHAESAWGLSEPVIQRILRHTNPRTQRRYRHADRANLVASSDSIRIGA